MPVNISQPTACIDLNNDDQCEQTDILEASFGLDRFEVSGLQDTRTAEYSHSESPASSVRMGDQVTTSTGSSFVYNGMCGGALHTFVARVRADSSDRNKPQISLQEMNNWLKATELEPEEAFVFGALTRQLNSLVAYRTHQANLAEPHGPLQSMLYGFQKLLHQEEWRYTSRDESSLKYFQENSEQFYEIVGELTTSLGNIETLIREKKYEQASTQLAMLKTNLIDLRNLSHKTELTLHLDNSSPADFGSYQFPPCPKTPSDALDRAEHLHPITILAELEKEVRRLEEKISVSSKEKTI